MILKFCGLELSKLQNYFLVGHNYIIQTLRLKIDERFSVPEERFLWLNIGFNRMKDMFLSLQPEEGWYEKIKIDLNYYFEKCKNIPDDTIIEKHNEELKKIEFLKDFYCDKYLFKMDYIYNNINLYEQKGRYDFNSQDRDLSEKIDKEQVKFSDFNDFEEKLKELRKEGDIGYDLINKILQKGYYEAFGVPNLKKFLLCEDNWKNINLEVQKKIIDSIIKIKYQLNENEKEIIRQFIIKYANSYHSKFEEIKSEDSAHQLFNFLNNFQVEKYREIFGYIKSKFDKPYYIYITDEKLNKIEDNIFYEIVEILINDIEGNYKSNNQKSAEFDFWEQDAFKLLWVLGIIGFKKIYNMLNSNKS